MMMYDDCLLRKVVVRVYSRDRKGSGWIVPSTEKGRFYCLTAKHCIEKGDVKLFLITDNQEEEPLEYTDILADSNEKNDIAILLVNYPVGRYPWERVFVGKANSQYDNGGLAGFPSSRAGRLTSYSGIFTHMDPSNSTLYMQLANVNPSLELLRDQINGISGGGFFAVEPCGEYKLLGIETELADRSDTFNEVLGPTINVFNTLLRSASWPLLARPKYRYASMSWNQGRNVLLRKKEYQGCSDWVDTDVSESLIRKIRNYFFERNEKTLLVFGFSGIGKTRTVLQACTEDPELSNALIFDSYEQFLNSFNTALRNYSNASGEEPIYLIVDDVSFEEWEELRQCVRLCKNIRVVAIAEMGLKESTQYISADPYMIKMMPHDEVDVVKIIHNSCQSLSEEELHAIYRLSDNDLRFALLIADEYAKSEDREIWSIRTQRSAMQILDRIMTRVVYEEYIDIVKIFSLFIDFGYQRRAKRELEFLENYFGLNEIVLLRAIDFCVNHRLGIKKGNYFELSPRAMARLLFSKYHVNLIRDYSDFINRLPTNELRRRFIMRARECGDEIWGEVRDTLVSWFQNKYEHVALVVSTGLFGDEYCKLSDGSIDEAMTYVEFIPEDGLPWMKRLIDNTDRIVLDKFLDFNGRREFVWTCEQLACFQEHFKICEQILFTLSQHETESGILNNSQGVWSELFGLLISNTEVPFKDRFEYLLTRMRTCKSKQNDSLFESALICALSWQGTRILPPKMIGGRLTPENWATKNICNWGDIIDNLQWSLTILRNDADNLPVAMRLVVFRSLKERMSDFMSPDISTSAPGLRDDYRRTLELFAEGANQRTEIVIAIGQQLEYEKILQERDDINTESIQRIAYLTQWRECLTDGDFISRLKVCLSESGFFEKEAHMAKIKSLAKELIANDDALQTLKHLLSIDGIKDYSFTLFAETLGEADTAYRLIPVINANFSYGENKFSEYYFFGVCNREKNLPDFVRQELNKNVTQNPQGVLRMSIACDYTNDGLKRILGLLQDGVINNYVLRLGEQQWVRCLSLEQMEKILDLLLKSGTKDDIFYFFRIGKAWLKTAPCTELEDFLYQCTENLSTTTYRRYIVEFVQLMKLMPQRLLQKCLILVIRSIDYSSRISNQTSQVSFIQKHANGPYANNVAFEVCDCLEMQTDDMRYIPSFSLLIAMLSVEAILQWIEIKPNRAEIIAYHLPAPSRNKNFVPEVTLSVLGRYGEDENVFHRFLSGIHAYEVYNLDSVVRDRKKTIAVLENYESHPLNVIRRWAEYEKKRIEGILNAKQQMDAENDRFSED